MIEYKYSTFWPRFIAGNLDGLIFWPVGWFLHFAYVQAHSPYIQVPIYMIDASAYLLYSIWMHGKFGQTLGKMACKIIVLDVSETSLSMKQAILRDILGVVLLPVGFVMDIPRIIHGDDIYSTANVHLIDWIIIYSTFGWFVIEVLTMLTNNKRRALHDFIAGSIVVRTTVAAPSQVVNAGD